MNPTIITLKTLLDNEEGHLAVEKLDLNADLVYHRHKAIDQESYSNLRVKLPHFREVEADFKKAYEPLNQEELNKKATEIQSHMSELANALANGFLNIMFISKELNK